METERLQKFFSDCGVLSRRAAEKEIAAGHVRVNGEIAKIGQVIDPASDKIEFNGKIIRKAPQKRYRYLVLYKPVGYMTTLSDEQDRKCIAELIRDVPSRVYPVGRLDCNSEGLLLLTDDGDLTNKLTHPRHRVPKIYHVTLRGHITTEQIQQLSSPMDIDGYRIQPVHTVKVEEGVDYTILQLTLYEGRNRQIRKMCDQVGLTIYRLIRVALGDLEIGTMKPGQWRYLTKDEIDSLKRQTSQD